MVSGMATTKITVTITEAQLDAIRKLVGQNAATSVSGFVQRAVDVALQDASGWDAMLKASLEETGGPLTKEERAWADELMGGKQSKRRRVA